MTTSKAISVFDPSLALPGAKPKLVEKVQRTHTLPKEHSLENYVNAGAAVIGLTALATVFLGIPGAFIEGWWIALFSMLGTGAISFGLVFALSLRAKRQNDLLPAISPALIFLDSLLPGKEQDQRFHISDRSHRTRSEKEVRAVLAAHDTAAKMRKLPVWSSGELFDRGLVLDLDAELEHLSLTLVRLTHLRSRIDQQQAALQGEEDVLATLQEQRRIADALGDALLSRCELLSDHYENLLSYQKRASALSAAQEVSHNDVLLAQLDGSSLERDFTAQVEHDSVRALTHQATSAMEQIEEDYKRLTSTSLPSL